MSNETKVNTKLLSTTADTISGLANELDRLGEDWYKTLSSLRSQWQGDSSDNIKNTMEQARKSSKDLIANLKNYPTALREIAGIYDKTESSVKESGKSLTFDKGFR